METNSRLGGKESALQQNSRDCFEKQATNQTASKLGTTNEKMQKNNCEEMSCSWTELENPYACLCTATGLFLEGTCVTCKHWVLKWTNQRIGTCSVCGQGKETQSTTGEKQVGMRPGSGITISRSDSCLWAERGANYQAKQNKSCCSCHSTASFI